MWTVILTLVVFALWLRQRKLNAYIDELQDEVRDLRRSVVLLEQAPPAVAPLTPASHTALATASLTSDGAPAATSGEPAREIPRVAPATPSEGRAPVVAPGETAATPPFAAPAAPPTAIGARSTAAATEGPPKPSAPPLVVPPVPAIATASTPLRSSVGDATAGQGPASGAVPPPPSPPEAAAGEDWEAVVGGNWLNKLGVLVLVIGLSLFLGYSFQQLPPAGRVALAVAGSLALLGAGVVLERREQYETFARGLIGGGWAALYATGYAAHNVEAARVIESPWIASVLLLAIAAGMIAHSLRYKSQTVTGVAYFVAFATLAISPASTFGLVATIPLAASLVVVAARFEWQGMAVGGLAFTYGAYLLAGRAGMAHGPEALWIGQAILSVYWLLFEAIDLLDLRHAGPRASAMRSLIPLNLCGFLGVSLLQWSAASPETLHWLFFGTAAGYVASALVRGVVLRRHEPLEAGAAERAAAGWPDGAAAVAVALLTAGLLRRFDGLRLTGALLLEAQFLLLAGRTLGQPVLRSLAALVFLLPVVRLLTVDLRAALEGPGGFRTPWSLVAAATSGLLYVNRALVSRLPVRGLEHGYTWVATTLGAVTLARELPWQADAPALLLFGIALVECGLATRLVELRVQGGLLGLLAAYAAAMIGLQEVDRDLYSGLAAASAAVSLWAVRVYVRPPQGASLAESRWMQIGASWSAVVLAAELLWAIVPDLHLGTAWVVFATALATLGAWTRRHDFVRQAALPLVLGLAVLLLDVSWQTSHPWTRLLPSIVVLWTLWAVAERQTGTRDAASRWGIAFAATAATLLTAVLVGRVAEAPWHGAAWATQALVLVAAGRWSGRLGLLWRGHAVATLGAGSALVQLTEWSGPDVGLERPVVFTGVVVALLYALAWVGTRVTRSDGPTTPAASPAARALEWHVLASVLYSWAAAVLVVLLLASELPRHLVIPGWTAYMLALIAAGRGLRAAALLDQAVVVAGLAALGALLDGGPASDAPTRSVRVLLGLAVVAGYFIAHVLAPRQGERAGGAVPVLFGRSRPALAAAAGLLMTQLALVESPETLLTLALGADAVVLLVLGFVLGERMLRLGGLALFGLAVLKLFLFDLRELETFARILSFIVLGLVLIATSWVYTRYREQVKRYL